MRFTQIGMIAAVFLFSLCILGCGGGADNANAVQSGNGASGDNQNRNAVKTNAEELALHIRLPYKAEDIVWKVDEQQKKLTAVFLFSSEDAERIIVESAKFGPAESAGVDAETWFPDELTAQSDMSGDNVLRGSSYSGNVFFNEPYSSGRIARIEGGNYFVLELFAK